MAKRLSMRVENLPTIVHTPIMIDVGEKHQIRLVETFYCNYTGADRIMYGKMKHPVSAKLIADLTRDFVAGIERLPLEDPLPYHPSNGGS